MIKLNNSQMYKIEHLFNDIKFYMGKSVLDGMMGEAYTHNIENPTIAYLLVRQYCFINGNSKSSSAKQAIENLPKTCKRIIDIRLSEYWKVKIVPIWKLSGKN